jgi:cysteine synthase
VPADIQDRLKEVGLWDLHPLNLFRIAWHNEPTPFGGLFGGLNYIEFPSSFTGTKARIVALVGKWFPTGVHKVGAAFGCLVPRLITGQFDPTTQKAVWPSTGNYCRGGAYDSHLLACESIAILPEGMSKERFDWLRTVAGEIIATPGCESNVKEIFDKCHELDAERGAHIVIFNQFEEFGNYLWHYVVTGSSILEVLEKDEEVADENVRGFVSATGSGGTLAAVDALKDTYPHLKIAASEALQCPTLLRNGFGGHRIEGIGDKHVPWVHNVKNTDMVIAVDDQDCMDVYRLFNEPAGIEYLKKMGVSEEDIANLPLYGISGIANVLASIKMAKYYELEADDVIFTVLTDSSEMYTSRLAEQTEIQGAFDEYAAVRALAGCLHHQSIDGALELTYYERLRIHNLKYYTWVEQQGKTYEEINAQWYDKNYWKQIPAYAEQIDAMIEAFNKEVLAK